MPSLSSQSTILKTLNFFGRRTNEAWTGITPFCPRPPCASHLFGYPELRRSVGAGDGVLRYVGSVSMVICTVRIR